MDSPTKTKAKGRARQLKGSVQERAGRAMGNRRMESSGRAERGKGKAQSAAGRGAAKTRQLLRKAAGRG